MEFGELRMAYQATERGQIGPKKVTSKNKWLRSTRQDLFFHPVEAYWGKAVTRRGYKHWKLQKNNTNLEVSILVLSCITQLLVYFCLVLFLSYDLHSIPPCPYPPHSLFVMPKYLYKILKVKLK